MSEGFNYNVLPCLFMRDKKTCGYITKLVRKLQMYNSQYDVRTSLNYMLWLNRREL